MFLLPCDKASTGRPHGPLALSEKYCCLCNLSGSCVRLGLTERDICCKVNSQITGTYLTTMDISRLQTDRSLSLLTHILFRANLPPELAFTRNTIANPPSASTSWRDLKIIFFYLKMLFVVIRAKLYKGSGKWQNDVIICAQRFTGSNHRTASQD